uniref:Uncharacterized protein n=1 Tax=Lepeophtheirus salmonis TaxID=72036 RepID=A0A0K2U1G9_LEPSM
MKRLRGHNQSK